MKAAIITCLAALAVAYDPQRTHLVAYNPATQVYYFRGNMPTNATAFVYDQLLAQMRLRAQEEGNVTLPENVYMIDITLNNVFDYDDHELDFWANPANAKLGELVKWPIGMSSLIDPAEVPAELLKEMALKGIWELDDIPAHVNSLLQYLARPVAPVTVIYTHCSAGCDRTGELVGAFRMTAERAGAVFPGLTVIPAGGITDVQQMYARDTYECGRSPNWFATMGLEWYCLYMKFSQSVSLGDCYNFATCKTFGSCHPANTTRV